MDQHFDDFFENAMNASDKGKFLKFPRYQKNLKCIFDGLYARRFLEDTYGFRELMSR